MTKSEQLPSRAARLHATRAIIARLLPRFGLAHWTVTVQDEEPEGGGEASTWISNDCYLARLRFSEKHYHDSVAEQHTTIVHELLHIVLWQSDLSARDIIGALDPTSRNWAEQRYERALERDIDHLSRVVAPLVPELITSPRPARQVHHPHPAKGGHETR